MSAATFKSTFVDAIAGESRKALFDMYEAYTTEFALEITSTFAQLIGGSFTTLKLHPKDIDMVVVLPKDDYQRNEPVIEAKFRRKSSAFPHIDAYFVPVAATSSSIHPFHQSDLLYWIHQFGHTRTNRRGKRFARGYVEINPNDFRYE